MSRYQIILLSFFLVILLWSGINPISQDNWILENIPVFIGIISLIIMGKYFKLSNLSYTLIAVYLLLPLIASHYGVSGVPFGYTLGKWMGIERNMYDRLTHFCFGLFLYFPIREIFYKITEKKTGLWSYYFPIEMSIMLSAVYEIFEWLAAISVNPVLAASFYGSQGDIFDTQKDMTNAIIGAIIASIIALILSRKNIFTLNHASSN